MKKGYSILLALLICVFVGGLCFIPSSSITEEAMNRYYNLNETENFNKSEESVREKIVKANPVGVMASAVFSDILPAANIAPLPIDFTPGNTPLSENFTEEGYRDDSIIVELDHFRAFDSDVYVSYIKIATASQLRTAVAGSSLKSTHTNQVSKIAKNYNAIVAVNGDYFIDTLGGYITRQGQTVRTALSDNLDFLFIDQYGDFHILLAGKENQEHDINAFLSKSELVNGFFFGPALVKDGEMLSISKDYHFSPEAANPRAGICQLAPLTYAIVTVNGRSNTSVGVTLSEFAEIMYDLGAIQAYNLDGGNSATLVYNGEVFNDKPQDERDVSDIIYFATATGAGPAVIEE